MSYDVIPYPEQPNLFHIVTNDGQEFDVSVATDESEIPALVEFHLNPPSAPPVDLVAYAVDLRWRKEVGGIVIGGVPVATDDRAKIMVLGARAAADSDPGWSTIWRGTDGNGYPINAGQMVAISDAVQEHVNGTFATLNAVLGGIESGTITDKAAVDAAFS